MEWWPAVGCSGWWLTIGEAGQWLTVGCTSRWLAVGEAGWWMAGEEKYNTLFLFISLKHKEWYFRKINFRYIPFKGKIIYNLTNYRICIQFMSVLLCTKRDLREELEWEKIQELEIDWISIVQMA